jgi:hypothetical protein
MKNLFLAATGVLAVVPGLVTLQSGVGCPPGFKVLFGGTVEAFGALMLVLLWANRQWLSRLTAGLVTGLAIGLAVFCFVCILLYTYWISDCVVEPQSAEHKVYGPVYYPLCINGNVDELVKRAGSRTRALDRFGPQDIVNKLNEMPGIENARRLTTTLFLVLYLLIFTTLTLAFGLVGLRTEPPAPNSTGSA